MKSSIISFYDVPYDTYRPSHRPDPDTLRALPGQETPRGGRRFARAAAV